MTPRPLLKPAQHAEQEIMTAILGGTYKPGSYLPSERILAERLGVTRPTLRETLKQLAGQGWVTISHGKPTMVNDVWKDGGLGILSALVRHGAVMPESLIFHLLEVRSHLLPPITELAIKNAGDAIKTYLATHIDLEDTKEAYTAFDWQLQVLLAKASGNPIYPLLLNDFSRVFLTQAPGYFSYDEARRRSKRFYRELGDAIYNGQGRYDQIMRDVMDDIVKIWNLKNADEKSRMSGDQK
ncbi:MAG: GntR family transcriptional regulator [Myxococcota bacterium]|nr:GntR family transcriptional regulator [Myxococcota bacterium]